MSSPLAYDPDTPSYDLQKIKTLLKNWKTRIITLDDQQAAVRLGYADEDEMVERACKLTESEFFKTMPSEKMVGLMQDVYYTFDGPIKIYLKVQIRRDGKGVIISFKPA